MGSFNPMALTAAAARRLLVWQRNNEVNLASDETIGEVHIIEDNTDTEDWPNRLMFRFIRDGGALDGLTSFFNEYGEFRVAPAKQSTVPFRIFTRETDDHTVHMADVPVFEIMSDRTTRVRLAAIYPDGTMEALNIGAKTVVLEVGDPVPVGTPEGSLIVRYVAP